MTDLQFAKELVQNFTQERDGAEDLSVPFAKYTAESYTWRGMRPFYEQGSAQNAIEAFWQPLQAAFTGFERREDIFFAGLSESEQGRAGQVWTCSMGQFAGLYDHPLVHIPANGRLTFLRYAEFHRVEGDKIAESALWVDLIGLMHDCGVYPLPPMTGRWFTYPGPKGGAGRLLTPHDPAQGQKTLALINEMAAYLGKANLTNDEKFPPDLLRKHWDENMSWYGPCGIGATRTIPRYQQQHQYPFRLNLYDKQFNGHVARLAEGEFGAFFGWPNLNNKNAGGFMGLPANDTPAAMRVVDVYRRKGDKLAENWVFIDIPHYLSEQGLCIFTRMRQLAGESL